MLDCQASFYVTFFFFFLSFGLSALSSSGIFFLFFSLGVLVVASSMGASWPFFSLGSPSVVPVAFLLVGVALVKGLSSSLEDISGVKLLSSVVGAFSGACCLLLVSFVLIMASSAAMDLCSMVHGESMELLLGWVIASD